MAILRDLVRVELAILVAGSVAVIWKILRKFLRPGGLRPFRNYWGRGMAGAIRLQMLAGSLVFALVYLTMSLRSAGGGALPPIPNYAATILAGSQMVFLGAAAWRSLRPSGILRGAFRSGGEK